MKVKVLKGQEHGHRRSTPPRLLQLTSPEVVTFSLGAENDKKLVHTETKELLASRGIDWYRTDQNGTITFVSPGTPGGGYSVFVQGGSARMSGPQDGSGCNEI